jgi:hypothetical protein
MSGSTRYRWLILNETYRYLPKLGKGDDKRRGQLCKVTGLPRPGAKPANVEVCFADAYTAVVPFGTLRKASDG